MSLRDARKRRRSETTLEITPLIDVVFLLLIFFMIASSFSRAGQNAPQSDIELNLPKAVTGQKLDQKNQIVLYITRDGTLKVRGDKKLEGDNLEQKLKNLHKHNPKAAILIKADKDATHGRVVEVLDKIRQIGITRAQLGTEQAK